MFLGKFHRRVTGDGLYLLEPVCNAVRVIVLLRQGIDLRLLCHPFKGHAVGDSSGAVGQCGAGAYTGVGGNACDRSGRRQIGEAFFQRHVFKGKDLVAVLRSECLPVDIQRDAGLIGVELHGDGLRGVLGVALSTEIDERLAAPVRLVEIEGFLFDPAVHADKPLVVAPGGSAFISCRTAEIKHVPDMGGPEIGTFHEDFGHVLMIFRLIALGVVAAFRLIRLPCDDALRAVFRQTEADFGILPVKFIQPFFVFLIASAVPAKVVIIAFDVRDAVERAVHGEHADMGNRRQAAGVKLLHKSVQIPVVFHKSGLFSGDGDLVGNSPEADGGMVIILVDQIGHLKAAVVVSLRIVALAADVGNLCPDDEAVLVTGIVEIPAVLIVGETDGIGAKLGYQCGIPVMLLLCQRISLPEQILMPGHAAQHHGRAVQEKAFFGVHREKADAEAGCYLVHRFVPVDQCCRTAIQVRVTHALPEVRCRQKNICLRIFRGAPALRDDSALCVRDGIPDGHVGRGGDDPAVEVQHGGGGDAADIAAGGVELCLRAVVGEDTAVENLRRDGKSRRTVEADIKMRFRQQHQVHTAIESAVEGKVRKLRINIISGGIVGEDGQGVCLRRGAERVREIDGEGGIAALMAHQLLTV